MPHPPKGKRDPKPAGTRDSSESYGNIQFIQGEQMTFKQRAWIMVATPTYSGTVQHECAQATQLATIHCLMRGVVLEWVFASNFSLVQAGRNWLTAEFLSRPECTHLFWLDDDLGFEPDAIIKLLDSDKDAVGGVYLTKHPKKSIFPYESLGPAVDHLQPARKLPGGFLLVKRHAVESVASRCEMFNLEHSGEIRETPHVFEVPLIEDPKHPGKRLMLGEDYVFCRRLIEAGFGVFARTDISFSHIGRYAYNGRLQRTLDLEAAAGVAGQGRLETKLAAVPFL